MSRKDKTKSQDEMISRRSAFTTSWRIVNPTGVVPVARPSANLQTEPIRITLNVSATGSSNKADGSDYDYDEF